MMSMVSRKIGFVWNYWMEYRLSTDNCQKSVVWNWELKPYEKIDSEKFFERLFWKNPLHPPLIAVFFYLIVQLSFSKMFDLKDTSDQFQRFDHLFELLRELVDLVFAAIWLNCSINIIYPFEYENEMYNNDFCKQIISLQFTWENAPTEGNNCPYLSNGSVSFNRLYFSSVTPLTTTTTKICWNFWARKILHQLFNQSNFFRIFHSWMIIYLAL